MSQLSFPDPPMDPIAIDVRALVQRSVATLYSYLVTRPTGRAVRMAIEAQLLEHEAPQDHPALSFVDLSEVSILDYSCADEVVARLLVRYRPPDRPRNAYFVFIGVNDNHRDAIQTALERHDLVTVAETAPDTYELVGAISDDARALWREMESANVLMDNELREMTSGNGASELFEELVHRRLVVPLGPKHGVRTLSVLARALRDSDEPAE